MASWGLSKWLLAFGLASLGPLCAHTRAASPTALTSLVEAEALCAKMIQEIESKNAGELRDQGIKIEGVEVYHIGQGKPEPLRALITCLGRAGLTIDYKWMTPEKMATMTEVQSEALTDAIPEVVDFALNYDESSASPPTTPVPRREQLKNALAAARARMRMLFGVPGGISFAGYKMKRTTGQRIAEGIFTAAKLTTTSGVLFYRLNELERLGAEVNFYLPLIVNAAFVFGFDYYQRGNSLFKSQGQFFSFKRGKFSEHFDFKFFLISGLIHSVVMRESILLSMYGATLTSTLALSALDSSIRGALVKTPMEVFTTMLQRNGRISPNWAIASNMVLGTFYATLQMIDLMYRGTGGAELFQNTLTTLGVTGGLVMAYQKRDRITHWLKRIGKRIQGIGPEPLACETLLVYRTSVLGDPN